MMRANPRLRELACQRCDARLPPGDYPQGCPHCLAQGHPSSLFCVYDEGLGAGAPGAAVSGKAVSAAAAAAAAASAGDALPLPVLEPLTLGEGNTPCLPAPRLAQQAGVGELWLKCESSNPTGTHKDRMAAQLVSRAVLAGAPLVVAASSGNGGVALAAYCAAAGLPIEIAIASSCPPPQREAMLRFGARLVAFDDSLARWHHAARRCREDGAFAGTNYLDPPVGTHPYGVEGYKPLAEEIWRQCGQVPTDVIVPTARGDLIWGMWLGWRQLQAAGLIDTLPRLHAVEPYARLSAVLRGGDVRGHRDGASAQYSIGGVTTTLQSLQAVQASAGRAIDVGDDAARAAHERLAALGLATELSSAAALAAVSVLRDGGSIDEHSRVVLMLTSDGRRGV